MRIALNNFAKDEKYLSCRSFLIALSESVETWFDGFLVAVRTIASEACRPVLSEAGDLWSHCEADYRDGFKMHVRGHLKRWFEEESPRSIHPAIEQAIP